MFLIKRTYGANVDWLYGWDKKWGTSCTTAKFRAKKYKSLAVANRARTRANKTCKNKPHGMLFSVYKIN